MSDTETDTAENEAGVEVTAEDGATYTVDENGEIIEDEPTEEQTEEETPEDEEGEPEALARPGLDEKEVEKRIGKLGSENSRHLRRVQEIMEEEALALIPCPVCTGFVDGWIFDPDAAPVSDEVRERVAQVLGIIDTTELQASPVYEMCPVCLGLGEVLTGSKVPGRETITCPRCKKEGFIRHDEPTNGTAHLTEVPQTTGPNVYQEDVSSDPEVQNLRERGFTVIPPMPIAGVHT